MAWTVTSGTITGVAGSLITVLDLELVTNRGWTKPLTGTNKAAYLNSANAAARRYFRIFDAASSPLTDAKEAAIQGFLTMSDVDTGTAMFPNNGTYTYFTIRKSTTADATARSYIFAGDDKTAIMFIQTGDTASTYYTVYFGDGLSYVPGDTNFSVLLARPTVNSGALTREGLGRISGFGGSVYPEGNAALVCGGSVGVAGSLNGQWIAEAGMFAGNSGLVTQAAIGGFYQFPNAAGSIDLGPFTFTSGTTVANVLRRGRLRGLFMPLHQSLNFNDGDTIPTSTGVFAGKTFRVVKSIGGFTGNFAGSLSGPVILETSDTVD
jgi:hypothetical protein